MKSLSAIALVVLLSTGVLADEVKPVGVPAAPAKPAACTPPDQLVINLPFAKAVTLNNILQDVDVNHRDWVDVARDVRAQLVGQCKEKQK